MLNITYSDAMGVRRNFGAMLDQTIYLRKFTMIKRAGKNMAGIVEADVLIGLQKYGQELLDKIAVAGKRNELEYGQAIDLSNEAKNSPVRMHKVILTPIFYFSLISHKPISDNFRFMEKRASW